MTGASRDDHRSRCGLALRPVHLLDADEMVTHRAMSQARSLTSGPLKPSMRQAVAQIGVGVDAMSLCSSLKEKT